VRKDRDPVRGRKREHYEKPSIKKKRKMLAAKKRAMKKMRKIAERG
jgi:small subunit ribosomal protein S21